MTPYEISQWDQERWEQQEAIANERYGDGATDAGSGQLPQFVDQDYLSGYVNALKHLPRDLEGRIVYPVSPLSLVQDEEF